MKDPVQAKLDDDESQELSLVEIIQRLIRARWWILVATLVFGLIGGGVALVSKATYSATATIFPVSSTSGSSQFSGLASMLGVSLPSGGKSDSGKTIGALLESRFFAEELTNRMGLVSRMFPDAEASMQDSLLNATASRVRASISYEQSPTTGVLAVTVELESPELARDTANGIIEELDRLLVVKSLTVNKKLSQSLETQIREQALKVNTYQQGLAQFQRDTTLLDPKQQSSRAMDSYLNMVQQKMNLELQLETATASYSPENPKVKLLTTQIANLAEQIAKTRNQVDGEFPSLKEAPENMIRFQNLTRDLEIATKVYTGLLSSLEQARLQENQDQVFVEPLDKAILPTAPNQRWYIPAAIGLILGLLGSTGVVAVWTTLRKVQLVLKSLSSSSDRNV